MGGGDLRSSLLDEMFHHEEWARGPLRKHIEARDLKAAREAALKDESKLSHAHKTFKAFIEGLRFARNLPEWKKHWHRGSRVIARYEKSCV